MLIKQQQLRTSTANSFSAEGCLCIQYYSMYIQLNVSCFVSFLDAFLKEKMRYESQYAENSNFKSSSIVSWHRALNMLI